MLNSSDEFDEREVELCYRTYIVTKPTPSYVANSIFGCVVNLALVFVGSFLNTLVVYVFWKTPKLRYKISYFMIMLLSSIDLLVTLIVHPSHLVMSIAEIVEEPNCVYKMFYHIAALLLSGMSFLTFFVMNIERYLSIVHPIFHLQHVTKMRCFIVCSLFWSTTIFAAIAILLNWNVQWMISVMALIVMIGTCYIYVAIFYIARKRRRSHQLDVTKRASAYQNKFIVADSGHNSEITHSDVNTDNPAFPDTLSDKTFEDKRPERQDHSKTINNQTSSNGDKAGKEKPNKTISFLHDLQLAKMYLLVVFSSFILNLPNAIVLGMFHEPVKTLNGLVQSKIWTVTLVMMNSTVNCLIFFWANQRLRKEGWKTCKRLPCRR